MDELSKLKEWVRKGHGDRTVNIRIGEPGDAQHMKIWAYSYELNEGQFVKSANDIDLEAIRIDAERMLYEKLKTRFER